MVSLLGQRENHKYRQIQADLRFSFYYTHIAISQGKIILHLYKKAIKRVIYLERFLSKRLRFLKIFGSLQRISFNYLKTHWYGTPHCLLKLDKWIYDKGYETCSNTFRTNARWQTLLVWSVALSPKGKTRKTVDKSHKTGGTIKHSAGEGKGGTEF